MAAATSVIKKTFADWKEDNAPRLGAALAYYTIFSLAPLLAIAIGVAGIVFGEQAAQGQLVDSMRGVVGEQAAQTIQTMIGGAGKGGRGILSTIFGFFFLILGASGVFGQLQSALNQIWEVAPKKGGGVKKLIKRRVLSMGMVFAIGFLLLVSLMLTAALSAMGDLILQYVPGNKYLLMLFTNLLSLAVVTLFFATIFKVLPDANIRWRDVWVGALVTAILFAIGQFLLTLYLSMSNVASGFGAAGSLLVLLVWIYYSAQIMFFGAEFTQVYARRKGDEIKPKPGAVKIVINRQEVE
jgi:membrane protein